MTEDPLPFLALGDSYTAGEGVDSVLRWPILLARRLRDAGVPVEDPLIIARTGWTTDELDAGIAEAGPEGPYALVSLLIGVNNQYRGRELEEYRSQFRALLARAISLAGGCPGRVLVLSIPDWGAMPLAEGRDRVAISDEIDRFNRVSLEECRTREVPYVDVTGISRKAASDPVMAAKDGLHPSGVQYGLWAEAAFPEAMRILDGASR